MNKRLHYFVFAVALLAGIAVAPNARAQNGNAPFHHGRPGANPTSTSAPVRTMAPPPARTSAAEQDKKTAAGESFFIVGSVDQQKSQFLLKRPTEVTLLVTVNPNTKYLDDAGQPLKATDFRTGDTVWLTSSGNPDNPTAVRIRKGQMTVADLHRYYLDYSEIK
jgi:hypothetical protein